MPLSKALEEFDVAMKSGVLTEEQLETIVTCARSPRKPLGENVAGLLGELAARFPTAARTMRDMAVAPKVHVRMNALAALNPTHPRKFLEEILRLFLRDRSSKIRMLAADKIMQFGFDELATDLEEAIAREVSAENKEVLERQRDLLCDGYHLRISNGQIWMSCRLLGGGIKGAFISPEDVRAKGAKAIAKSLGAEVRD